LGKSAERASKLFAVSATNVKKAKKLLSEAPDLAQKVLAGRIELEPALREHRTLIAREKATEEAKREPADPDSIKVLHGDFRQVLGHLSLDSVDLLLTDPPYDKASLPLWGDLFRFAARVLKPGAFLVAMSGKEFLPQVMAQAQPTELEWFWEYGVTFHGPTSSHPARQILTVHRPLLVWRKPGENKRKALPGRNIADMLYTDGVDRTFHPFGQKPELYMKLLSAFSQPGQFVVDPFGGGGTVAVACQRTGRRCETAEIDTEAYETISRRLFGKLPSKKRVSTPA
jgi:site-specific DNA-methyltransferase (adenine-specific)